MSKDVLSEGKRILDSMAGVITEGTSENYNTAPNKDEYMKDFEASMKKVVFNGLSWMKAEERTAMADKFYATIKDASQKLVDDMFSNFKQVGK